NDSGLAGELRHGRDEHLLRVAAASARKPSETCLHQLERPSGWLVKHRARSTRQRFSRELRAVTALAAAGKEQRAATDRTRVECHIANLDRAGNIDETGGELGEAHAACCRWNHGGAHRSSGCS